MTPEAPLPILVVEVLSATTRRRDLENKRVFYREKCIPEYWVVDRYSRSVIRVKSGVSESVTSVLTWAPDGANAPLEIDLVAMFAETRDVREGKSPTSP